MGTAASGTAAVGTIKVVVGDVKIVGVDGVARQAMVGDKVFAKETIQTNANAIVQVQLENGRMLDLGRDSKIALDDDVLNVGQRPTTAPATTLNGGAGTDVLNGGPGVDTLNGNGGNDILVFDGTNNDVINGGAGFDILRVDDGALALSLLGSATTNLTSASQQVINLSNKSITGIEAILITEEAGQSTVGVDPNEGTRYAEALGKLRLKVDAEVSADLARIRKKLKLSQRRAAAIAGGGVNAFSRYENGKARPVAAVVNLFRLLDRHPELIDEIAA